MKIGLVGLIFVAIVIQTSLQNASNPEIQQLTEPVDHAEEPTWDGRTNILYYVDIHSGRIFAYHYNTQKQFAVQLDGTVTPVIPSRNNTDIFLVGVNRSVVAIEWDSIEPIAKKQRILSTVSNDYPESRFNDGKADSDGRLWWGTIGVEKNLIVAPYQAYFYEFTRDHLRNPYIIRKYVTNSNGLAWNKANNKLYYIDTPTLKVVEFEYCAENGTISAQNRTAFDVASYPNNITGLPDGMTIDDEDNLWIALYGGKSVIKADPRTGELLQVVTVPAKDATSAMWGGPNLDILYVTTSRISLTPEEREQYPQAGSVFAIKNLNAKGLPMFGADIIDSL